MILKPYKYQKQGIERIQDFDGCALIADEMGLGKTLQVLIWMWMYLDKGPYIVVCPANLKWNWQHEVRMHTGLRAEILEGRKPPAEFVSSPNTVYIINYDILGDPSSRHTTWSKLIKRMKPSMIAFDECHYLKSRTSQRTKYSAKLARRIKHRIGISGTPLTSHPSELWPILNIIRPDMFRAFLRFANRYCKPEWTPWGVKYTGAARLKELHRLLKQNVMIRRLKKNVLKELPSKQRVVVPVELSNVAEYNTAERDFTRWLIRTHPKKASKARGAERLLRWGYLKRLVGELKLKAVTEWISNYLEASDKKLIVFGTHKKVVRPLHKQFEHLSVRVDGSVTGHKRQEAVDKFTKVKHIRAFFGNMDAAGVGWNGQVAEDVMFCELHRLPGVHTQAEDRAHRIGQNKQVTAYYLVAVGTMEEEEVRVLQDRQRVLDKVLDGKATKENFDLLDRVEDYLINKGKSLRKKRKK